MRTRLFLNPGYPQLVGSYPAGADSIHVALDSSDAAFTVQLPDVTQPEHKEFLFYNVPANGIGNNVTIQANAGQFINVSDTYHVLAPGDTVTFVADLRSRWLITDVNAAKTRGIENFKELADFISYTELGFGCGDIDVSGKWYYLTITKFRKA